MSEKTYPYEAWKLMPSFRPAKVTVVECYHAWNAKSVWEKTDSGALVNTSELFPTKEDAIEAGWGRIHTQITKIAKMGDSLNKKRAALVKATGA